MNPIKLYKKLFQESPWIVNTPLIIANILAGFFYQYWWFAPVNYFVAVILIVGTWLLQRQINMRKALDIVLSKQLPDLIKLMDKQNATFREEFSDNPDMMEKADGMEKYTDELREIIKRAKIK